MQKFIVTTDSGCDLPLDYLEQNNIYPIKMKYTIDNNEFIDSMKPDECHEFYEKMKQGAAPKTSQINPAEYIDFFTPFLEKGLSVVHISISSGISGTYENGIIAINMLKSDFPNSSIFVLDSTTASLGSGMLTIKAAQMRDEGKTAQECFDWLEQSKSKVNVMFTTGDLKYLRRGGRINAVSALLGTVLSINAIMKLTLDGKIVAADKARGKAATYDKVYKNIEKTVIDAKDQTFYISHSDSIDEAKAVGEEVKNKFGFKDVFYSDIGSIIGAHTGPGLIAMFYYGIPRTND